MTDRPTDFEEAESPQSLDWEALARHVVGEDTAETRARVDALIEQPSEKELAAALRQMSDRLSQDVPSNIDIESALQKVKARMSASDPSGLRLEPSSRRVVRPPGIRWRVALPAVAAAALIAIGLGTWASSRAKPTVAQAPPLVASARMLATGIGTRDSLRLSDGTNVILGPQSSVKVAAGYGTGNREVEIRGDAYFDVTHNASQPFTVRTGNATIKDVGTKFAVRSDGAGGVGVAVTEGSVSLARVQSLAGLQQSSTAPAQSSTLPVVLKAGDRGTLNSSGKIVVDRGGANSDDVAWLDGRLVFRETPLSEVVSSMRRWYGIELQLADPALASRHLTATFSGEPANRVLDVLRLALGADIERRGDTAIVRSAKGRSR